MRGQPKENLPTIANLKGSAIYRISAAGKWMAGSPLCNWTDFIGIDEAVEPVTTCTKDFCGLEVALELRTVTGLRVKEYEDLGLKLEVTRVRSLWVADSGCWDVSAGKVVLGRFEGGNSGRTTTLPMSRMAPAVRWVCDLGFLFWCKCYCIDCFRSGPWTLVKSDGSYCTVVRLFFLPLRDAIGFLGKLLAVILIIE